MTVSTTSTKTSGTGNGVTTVFAYNFKIQNTDEIKVYINSVLQTLITNYSVTGVGSNGGTVVFVTPPVNTAKVRLVRVSSFTQSTQYNPLDSFPAVSHEAALDKLTLTVQNLEERINRSPSLNILTDYVGSLEMPTPIARRSLVFNATLTGMEYANTDVDATAPGAAASATAAAASATAAAASTTFLQAGAGAVTRTVQSKLRDSVNVKDFGAVGNGVTDDTVAIQAALNATRNLYFPDGTYIVSATLTMQPDTQLQGTTPEKCLFQRTTAYGDTFKIGAAGVANAGSVTIKGFWFYHIYSFNNGTTYVAGTSVNILNKNPTAIHLNIFAGQNVRIEDCWFTGLGHGIKFTDSTQMWVNRCIFNGMWDLSIVAMQDTTSSIYATASASNKRCALMHISHCMINGHSASAAVNVTTGSVTTAKTLNNGPRYGIFIQSCEQFSINNNYIGGQSAHNIYIETTAITGHGHITSNMIDGASEYSIRVICTNVTYPVSYLMINNNTAVGYGNDKGFLWLQENGTIAPATRVNINDNNIQFYLRAPIKIERTSGVKISGNTVAAYNSDNSVTSDPYVQAGIVLDITCAFCVSTNNLYGGGINFASAANNCKWGIYYYSAVNNFSALERTTGLGIAGGTVVGGLTQTYPV